MDWLDGMWDNTPFGGNAGASAPDPYEAYDEYRRRKQMESDRDYGLRARQIKQQAEQIAISKGQAKANEWYQRQMVQLAKEKFENDKYEFEVEQTGYINGNPTLNREKFFDTSLQGWTDKALTLSRLPKDWVTLARMQRGVANAGGNIPGLAWASGGQVGNTAFAGNPESNSLGNLLGNMGINAGGGGAAGGGWASQAAQQANQIATTDPGLRPDQAQLYQTAREFAMNPQGAAPGWFEGLDPLTRDLLQGAAEDQGLDWASALSRHARSRWGAGSGSSMAA